MRAAYADPPYFGSAKKLYGHLHELAGDYDSPDTHRVLVDRLSEEFDCWALSLSSPSVRTILPMCPDDVRLMAWVKPFAIFKPGVGVAYAWEPVIVRGGRKRSRQEQTVRDWVKANITLKRGLTGAKPKEFCFWIFDVLGLRADDEFCDLFPGTGIVMQCWEIWQQNPKQFDLTA